MQAIRSGLILAFLLLSGEALANRRHTPPLPVKQFPTAEARKAIAEYLAQTAEFRRSYAAYDREARTYWEAIDSKRTQRRRKRAGGKETALNDYVLDQPPSYSGPPKPALPPVIPPRHASKTKPKNRLPVVADFLRHAKARFKFTPEQPANEMDYKRTYAKAALAAGIRKDQAVRIYGFEAGGNGGYDIQAGLESNKKGRRPISTALGYNQLLVANTIGLLAEYGRDIVGELKDRLRAAKGRAKRTLRRKVAGLRRMVRYARALPYRWSIHVQASRTSKGRALHAVILDREIGPLLQTQKLVNSISYAKRLGYEKALSAAELEMLNLTGDGNGFDMISMPESMREKVPTSNFFQRGGYERNPVASRNNTVASLLAATDRKMDYHAELDGAKQMAAAFDEVMGKRRSSENAESYGVVR